MASPQQLHLDKDKLKQQFDVSHFDINAILRGMQLTLVGGTSPRRFSTVSNGIWELSDLLLTQSSLPSTSKPGFVHFNALQAGYQGCHSRLCHPPANFLTGLVAWFVFFYAGPSLTPWVVDFRRQAPHMVSILRLPTRSSVMG